MTITSKQLLYTKQQPQQD